VLKAIRENEPRAISLGYRTERYKSMAFVLSATFAGWRGRTRIVFQLASSPMSTGRSGEVILMTRSAARHHLRAVVGGFFVVTMENYLTSIGQWVFVVQGSSCVLRPAFRRGLSASWHHFACDFRL